MIQRQKIDLSEERKILSHMITSTSFLREVQTIAIPKLFKSSYSQTVAEWIWEYYEYTKEAPEQAIQEVYLKKKKTINDEEDDELIAEFLTQLSKDWTKAQIKNIPYTVKNAIDYFKLRSLDSLKEEIEGAVGANDPAFGERLISEYKRVEKPSGKGVNLLKDTSEIIHAFSQEDEKLFQYPGDLGKSIGPFMRGDFFAIIGEEKKGKTHYLWYTAYRALLLGMKVIFISLEMSKKQMLRRMWQGMIGQPVKSGSVMIPYFKEGKDDLYDIKKRKEKRSGIDPSDVQKKQQSYRKAVRTGSIHLIAYPSYGASVKDVETELVNLEYYEGFIPDVIVVDYADIMKPVSDRLEYRHQLDAIWKALRGMAQERSALVVTGSQVNEKGRVAEDRRKMAHVTKMIQIEQTDDEGDLGVIMMRTVVQREGKAYRGRIGVLQCYDIGRPYIDSKMADKINFGKKKKKEKK